MSRKGLLAAWAGSCVLTAAAQENYTLRFDQDVYVIQPGQSFEAKALLDPPPPGGLYSYAVKLQVDELKARVSSLSAITVPGALDYNGVLGRGAYRALGTGFAGVKGTVNFFAAPQEFYGAGELASFTLTDRSGMLGEYPVNLDGFNTLGPTESLFVTGRGEVLDRFLVFKPAVVRVVPEPATWSTSVFGGAVLWLWRRNGRRRRPRFETGCRGSVPS